MIVSLVRRFIHLLKTCIVVFDGVFDDVYFFRIVYADLTAHIIFVVVNAFIFVLVDLLDLFDNTNVFE